MSNMVMSFAWLLMLQAQAASEPVDAVAEILESAQSTVPAKVISRNAPRYPGIELARGHEAWVRVAFCIDETGKPQNIAVLDSVGNQRFERSALNTVVDWQYEPALVDGVPTWQSRNEVYISFALEGDNKGARRSFIRKFKKIGHLIDDGKLDEAEAVFDELQGSDKLSLYELTKLWARRVRIEAARGDFARLRMALQRATASDGQWIDTDSYIQLLTLLIKVQASQGRYAESLYEFDALVEAAGEEHDAVQALSPAIDEVRTLVDSDKILSIAAEIRTSDDCLTCDDSWDFRPVRRRLGLANVEGRLDSIEMRCDHKRFTSEVSDQVEWQIPESWGTCHFRVYGEPGTRFDVLQLPAG